MVSEPCDTSSATNTVFDASYSKDPSGRQLAGYAWSQSGTVNPVLQALVDAANAGTGADRLVLPPSSITQLPNADYILAVTVTSYLGVANTASMTFSKTGAGTAPVVSIVGGQTQEFKLSEGIRVSSQLIAKSVCSGKQVGGLWLPFKVRSAHLAWCDLSSCSLL